MLRLADLPLSRRLTELEFHLPAQRLDAGALNRALAELGYRVPPLTFGALAGYLKGFIDLVFEHEGRYFVLDWKSNHLGRRAADYSPDALAPTMDEAAYRLQYLLYSVALDRYLARRLPGYDAETHFGGVLYLFVRGLRPDWRAPDGQPAGLFFDRPPVSALRRLSALLGTHGDAP
jgi:exodeoxyribonuclease V beta subunit